MATPETIEEDLLCSLLADDIGLYEVFWELNEGPIVDADFGYGKVAPWEVARDAVVSLIDRRLAKILRSGMGMVRTDLPDRGRSVVLDKSAWHPFGIGSQEGYVVCGTSRWDAGARLWVTIPDEARTTAD